uniref:Sperm-activating peptide (Ser-1, Ala-3, Gly-5 speract) n=1 Tax=Hemicentrotus pulcherrimus TaxID=7650 RepID=Q7M4D1_HEMPU
SFALGGGGVG